MNSSIRHMYDAALALQPVGTAAITASADSVNDVDLYRLTSGRGDRKGKYGLGSFDVVINVKDLDFTDGDEEYELQIQTVDGDGANAVAHQAIPLTAALIDNPLVLAFHPETLKARDADAAALRIHIDVTQGTGSTASCQYLAFAAPHAHS